jgi:hypothetical protein
MVAKPPSIAVLLSSAPRSQQLLNFSSIYERVSTNETKNSYKIKKEELSKIIHHGTTAVRILFDLFKVKIFLSGPPMSSCKIGFSLDDFTSLTKEKLISFKNCGRKTVREILNFLPVNRAGGVLMPPLPPEDQLVVLPPESSIELLLQDFSAERLHPGFRSHLKNKDLALSVRSANILEKLQLETIGEVMLTSGADLLKQPNSAKNVLGNCT